MRTVARILLLFVLSPYTAKATEGLQLKEARTVAMGGASVAVESVQNPASTVFALGGSALLAFESRFGVNELSSLYAATNYSFQWLQIGAVFSRFGYERYNETMVGVDISKRLASWLGLGVRINYTNLFRSQEDGSDQSLSADLGISLRPTDKLSIGILANNLLQTSLRSYPTHLSLPLRIRAGAAYRPNDRFTITGEVDYTAQSVVIGRAGIEFYTLEVLPLRLGITTAPVQPTFGLGYQPSNRWSFDIASSYHTALGFSPTLSMFYCY